MTKRQRWVLEQLRDNPEADLVYERGVAYCGDERIAARTVIALLRLMAISLDSFSTVGEFERYEINGTGLELLQDEKALEKLQVMLGRARAGLPPE